MASEYSYELKIPKDRVAVLIGTSGETKKEIEAATNSDINIDSKEGDVIISGEDTLGIFNAKDIVKAIGRGFNPDVAKLLLKPDYNLEVIQIQDFVGKSKNKMLTLKGRVIGKEGKSRRIIEELTETYITVYGKTIAIIGLYQNVIVAKRACESLLNGSPHSTVYKWLEKKRKALAMMEHEKVELKEKEE